MVLLPAGRGLVNRFSYNAEQLHALCDCCPIKWTLLRKIELIDPHIAWDGPSMSTEYGKGPHF